MSKTLKIINGQIDFDPSTGQIVLVENNRKAAQDLAACLLQDYLPEIDYGSQLRALMANPIPLAGDLFLRFYIAEAISKLQSKQQDDPYLTRSEQITDITALQLVDDGEGTTAFFVGVSTADGGEEVVAAQNETQLNHQYERF